MSANPKRIIVSDSCCSACDVPTIRVYHQGFPEMRSDGMSAVEAVEHLAGQLSIALDSVSDSLHSEAVRAAIDDTEAFLGLEGIIRSARNSEISSPR